MTSEIGVKLRKFIRMRIPARIEMLTRLLQLIKAKLYYRAIFGQFGDGSILGKPVLLTNPHWMSIGRNVHIRNLCRLEAVQCDDSYSPEIRIGDHVRIEHFVQISSAGRLVIGPGVAIGSRSMLLCATHPFLDVRDPVRIGDRLGGKDAFLEIGEGTMIGSGCAILHNVRIGKHVVVGANSVVQKSIPDYCVVQGNPAKIILRYDETTDQWYIPDA